MDIDPKHETGVAQFDTASQGEHGRDKIIKSPRTLEPHQNVFHEDPYGSANSCVLPAIFIVRN